jgi:hypothetical protein
MDETKFPQKNPFPKVEMRIFIRILSATHFLFSGNRKTPHHMKDQKDRVVEEPAETQTSIRIASHLVRAPNSRSGGREFKSPQRQEFGALTKSGKILGARSFYSGDPDVIT